MSPIRAVLEIDRYLPFDCGMKFIISNLALSLPRPLGFPMGISGEEDGNLGPQVVTDVYQRGIDKS